MSSLLNTPKLKKLAKKWDDKLKASGFKDIEHTVGENRVLTQFSSNVYKKASKSVRENKEAYFTLLGQAFSAEKFPNEVDKIVMLKASQGISIKNIVNELNKLGHKRLREFVRFTIRKYENKWNIKNYSKKQLTSNRP